MSNDLIFSGDSPVVITRTGGADRMFSPLRSSSCDIGIVTGQILDDLYTAGKNEITVTVERETYNSSGTVTSTERIWEGYMTPNLYTQELTQNLDAVEMTAIDPLSILKWIRADEVFDREGSMTIGDLIGKSLGYVCLDANTLYVEDSVNYNQSGYTGIMSLKCNIGNFWDEGGEPATLNEIISECLKPFAMSLVFTGSEYYIYDMSLTHTSTSRSFTPYTISKSGAVRNTKVTKYPRIYDFYYDGWKPQNISAPTLTIDSTYGKVTGVVSTSIPDWSSTAFDLVDIQDTDKYDIFQFNVDTNPAKGYRNINSQWVKDSSNMWFYIWNGVYENPDFNLDAPNLTGYSNINKAYNYVTGNTGYPDDSGSILNFYGGMENSNGTGRYESIDIPTDVSRNITAYAPDNGTPPEFLEKSDLSWSFSGNFDVELQDVTDRYLTKSGKSSSKFGQSTSGIVGRVVYHQEYDNIVLSQEYVNEYIELDLEQSYSRTGTDINIPVIAAGEFDTGKQFAVIHETGESDYYRSAGMISSTGYMFPQTWKSDEVKADHIYFNRYNHSRSYDTGTTGEIWDRRRIDLWIETSGGTRYQFNGKHWVQVTAAGAGNSFHIAKLINGNKVFNNRMRYNVVECSDGTRYSISDRDVVWHLDSHGGVSEHGEDRVINSYRTGTVFPDWSSVLKETDEGKLGIIFPSIPSSNTKVVMDIWSSNLLGMTGASVPIFTTYSQEYMVYQMSGTGKCWVPDSSEQGGGHWDTRSLEDFDIPTGMIMGERTSFDFIPVNATYVKAEHLDMNIGIRIPDSNLGQMFSQSDIKYSIKGDQSFYEEYSDLKFNVNTYNPLVRNSFSYLIFGESFADPAKFTINQVSARPEIYTLQAYMNYLGEIRRIYDRTILPEDLHFSNLMTYMTIPESGQTLTVIGDTWDILTNRHSIEAVDNTGMKVQTLDRSSITEIPRTARNELFNLPSAKK